MLSDVSDVSDVSSVLSVLSVLLVLSLSVLYLTVWRYMSQKKHKEYGESLLTPLDVFITTHQEGKYSVDNIIIYGRDIETYFNNVASRHPHVIHAQQSDFVNILCAEYGGCSLVTLLKILNKTGRHIVLLVSNIGMLEDRDMQYICYLMDTHSNILVVLGQEGTQDMMYETLEKNIRWPNSPSVDNYRYTIDMHKQCILRYNTP